MNKPQMPQVGTDRDTILTAAAHGNAAALDFLRSFARWAHWVDDLADGDKLPPGHACYSAAVHAENECEWLLTLSANPFFLAHRAQLVPVIILALNSWVASEEWREQGLDERNLGRVEVLAGQANEVFWLVAWLTGGWMKLREVSRTYRDYDTEATGDQKANGEPAQSKSIVSTHVPCLNCGGLVRRGQEFSHEGQSFCSLDCAEARRRLFEASRDVATEAEQEPWKCSQCNRRYHPSSAFPSVCPECCTSPTYRPSREPERANGRLGR